MGLNNPHRRLYRDLSRAMRSRKLDGCAIGLSDTQLDKLCWIAWLPRDGKSELCLGFNDGCHMPEHLAGNIPVAAVRTERRRLHADILVENVNSSNGIGTATALVRRRASEDTFVLTAGHVLGGSVGARNGDRILLSSEVGRRAVSCRLEQWLPSFHAGGPDTYLDAGLARLDQEQLRDLLDLQLSLPAGVARPAPGMEMRLRTRGMAIPSRMLGYVSAWMDLDDGGSTFDYHLLDGLAYEADVEPEGGDSGAPIWDGNDRILAMHIGAGGGGGVGNGIAVPIQRVLDQFMCSIVERSPLVPRSARPAPAAPVKKIAHNSLGQSDVWGSKGEMVLARTLWGEARGEGREGMVAVANVVLNRVKRRTYWGKTVEEVCCKPYQFSCWNTGDPNLEQLLRVNESNAEYVLAKEIASRARAQGLEENTKNATHYHARSIRALPKWAQGRTHCAEIGRHLFYNDID